MRWTLPRSSARRDSFHLLDVMREREEALVVRIFGSAAGQLVEEDHPIAELGEIGQRGQVFMAGPGTAVKAEHRSSPPFLAIGSVEQLVAQHGNGPFLRRLDHRSDRRPLVGGGQNVLGRRGCEKGSGLGRLHESGPSLGRSDLWRLGALEEMPADPPAIWFGTGMPRPPTDERAPFAWAHP